MVYIVTVYFLILMTVLTIGKEITEENLKKDIDEYKKLYENFREEEEKMMTGANITFTEPVEVKANSIFMEYKSEELRKGRNHSSRNLAAMHFYNSKTLLGKSKVYQAIRKMPKGATLSIHTLGSVSSKWLVEVFSYMENLQVCKSAKENNLTIFTFRNKEEFTNCRLVNERRRELGNASFDAQFKKLVDMDAGRNTKAILPNDQMWKIFCDMFDRIMDAVFYKPAFEAFHWRMLEEMYEDNIMYAEVRSVFRELYDNTGKHYSREDTVELLIEIIKKFKKEKTDFLGAKIIYSIIRHGSEDEIREEMEHFQKLQARFPHYIVGLDLVGHEDKGQPLHKFIKDFIQLEYDGANFFFNAGETNLYGDSSDYNLYDAALLHSRRIGHGYSLWKHPLVMKEIVQINSAVEICPVSNQITSFIYDLRNHPGGMYLSQNIPVVVGSDSPGFLGTTGLSTDFYYTIMSLASSKADLRLLKQLILNSLQFSDMTGSELEKAQILFTKKWDAFLNELVSESNM